MKKHKLFKLMITLCVICMLNSIIVFGSVLQPIGETTDSLSEQPVFEVTDKPIDSETESQLKSKIIQNDAREGIVKIVTGYEFADTSFDLWTVGYGFLVTKEHVITSRNTAVLDQTGVLYKNVVGKRGANYQKLGINLNDYQETLKHVRTYVLLENETKVEATVNQNAIGDSFVLLNLSSRINSKNVLTLSEDTLEDGMKLYAIGPYKIDPEQTKLSDVQPAKKTDFFGKLSEVTKHRKNGTSEYVEFKGNFTHLTLAPGCPLVSKDQVVVGLITDGVNGNGSAVDIQTIEKFLDAANIEYGAVKSNVPSQTDTSTLQKLVNEIASMDISGYTHESLSALNDELINSKKLLAEPNVSGNRVEKEYESLKLAYSKLQKIDYTGLYIRIGAIAGGVVVLIIILIFVKKKIHNIGKDEFEIEDERREKEEEKERKKREKEKNHHNDQVVNTNYDHRNTDLDSDSDEDKTGVLDGATGILHENAMKAWLVHESGNRITINKNKFTIGKSKGVDYRINNNTVSRNHCRILMSNDKFYVEDLGSTNGTFIDDEQLSENLPTIIQNGQKLKLSDEVFTFEISGGS